MTTSPYERGYRLALATPEWTEPDRRGLDDHLARLRPASHSEFERGWIDALEASSAAQYQDYLDYRNRQ